METIEKFKNFVNDVNTYYEGNMIDLFPYVDMLNNVLKILNNVEKLKKAIEILKCFLNYVEFEFDTFVTSQCTDEGQKLLKEVFGEYEPVAINNVSWEE